MKNMKKIKNRPRKLHMSYIPKPCNLGYRNYYRNYLKKFYKKKKEEDREIGIKINNLIFEFHYEMKEIEKGNIDKESEEYLKNIIKNIGGLKEEQLFKNDFPSFSRFYKYCKKEKLSIKDIEGL